MTMEESDDINSIKLEENNGINMTANKYRKEILIGLDKASLLVFDTASNTIKHTSQLRGVVTSSC